MAPNYAAQAAMKCAEPIFQRYLQDAYGGADSPVDALYKVCAITSRKQLNTEPDAADRWRRALKWFGMWRMGAGKTHSGHKNPPFIMGQLAAERETPSNENPFQRGLPKDAIDKDFDMWAQGWKVSAWRVEHDTKITG